MLQCLPLLLRPIPLHQRLLLQPTRQSQCSPLNNSYGNYNYWLTDGCCNDQYNTEHQLSPWKPRLCPQQQIHTMLGQRLQITSYTTVNTTTAANNTHMQIYDSIREVEVVVNPHDQTKRIAIMARWMVFLRRHKFQQTKTWYMQVDEIYTY